MSENKISKYFLDKIQEAKEKQLEQLDLSYEKTSYDGHRPLTEIPEELFELKQIKFLKLNNHQIKTLPESIDNLSNLRRLDLINN